MSLTRMRMLVLYWLCVTSRGNWNHVRSRKRWAVPLRHASTLERTSPGDLCIVYLTADGGRYPSALNAIFQIKSDPRSLDSGTQNTMFDQLYPVQVEIDIETELERAVPFQPLIPSLSFIRKPAHWGAYFQGLSMRQLEENDFSSMRSTILGEVATAQ